MKKFILNTATIDPLFFDGGLKPKKVRGPRRHTRLPTPVAEVIVEYAWFCWHIHIGGDADWGFIQMPVDDIGDGLTTQNVQAELNIRDCFVIEYKPEEGDYLKITRRGRYSPYLAFRFTNGHWVPGRPLGDAEVWVEEGEGMLKWQVD